jgi:hypothetical protein
VLNFGVVEMLAVPYHCASWAIDSWLCYPLLDMDDHYYSYADPVEFGGIGKVGTLLDLYVPSVGW